MRAVPWMRTTFGIDRLQEGIVVGGIEQRCGRPDSVASRTGWPL